jgi:GGDEF domain-containing protein
MSISRIPSHLTLVPAPIALWPSAPAPTRIHPEVLPASEQDPETGVATRRALVERLAMMGDLAPRAPLSFLVVHVEAAREDAETAAPPFAAVATRIRELTRATDCIGRLRDGSFGVVLQGTGVTAAGAVAARLSHHLNRLPDVTPRYAVSISAATGTGANALTLPSAAMDAFEPGCG